MDQSKLLVIGVGNPWRGDDGIGPKIINLLQENPQRDFAVYDGGTDALALIDLIAEYSRVLIIDAAFMNLPPGTIKVFSPQEALLKIKSETLSTHGFGLAELLQLLNRLEITTKINILAIQPKNINFGAGLSEEVQRALTIITAPELTFFHELKDF